MFTIGHVCLHGFTAEVLVFQDLETSYLIFSEQVSNTVSPTRTETGLIYCTLTVWTCPTVKKIFTL
jgi:hypothetical protein